MYRVSSDLTKKLWQQTGKHLDRFPGRTREIRGKQYLNWEDYLSWRGRRVKGNISSGLSPGLTMSRWNQWVEEQGGKGKATLAETQVGKLACRAEGYQYQVQEGSEGLDLERRQRQGLLKSLELNRPGRNAEKRFFERVRHLKELAHEFLTELYTLRRVINSVTQLYLKGVGTSDGPTAEWRLSEIS